MNRAAAQMMLLIATLVLSALAYQLASERWRQLTWNSAAAGLVAGLTFMLLLDLAMSRYDEDLTRRPVAPRVIVDREMLATELASAEIRLFDSVADASQIRGVFREDHPERALAELDFQLTEAMRALAHNAGIFPADTRRHTRELLDELIGRGVVTFTLAKPLNEVLSTIERVRSGAEIDDFDTIAIVRAGRRIITIFHELIERVSR
jgi:hypothetical protein